MEFTQDKRAAGSVEEEQDSTIPAVQRLVESLGAMNIRDGPDGGEDTGKKPDAPGHSDRDILMSLYERCTTNLKSSDDFPLTRL